MVSKFSDIVVLVPGIVSAMPIGTGSVRARHRVARRGSLQNTTAVRAKVYGTR